MAEPSPKDLNLPKDVQSLSALRDQLGDYLSTVERNTDAVNTWLSSNNDKIILSHQQLERAFKGKDAANAASLLAGMGDIAGFVLSLQDFRAKSEAAFGKDNAFLKAAAGISDSLPAALLEALPKIAIPEKINLTDIAAAGLPAKEDEQKNWWSSASGWFNKKEKKQKEQERQFHQQLRNVKAEILGLQSDRHYYIDSFMGWVADTMSPEAFDSAGMAPDSPAKMLQYHDPAHIIGIAQADYQEAVENRAREVRDAALAYSRTASALDRQDIPVIIKDIKDIFSRQATQTGLLIKKNLLQDYEAVSLNEIILKHIGSRADQARLLRSSLTEIQEVLAFSDAKTPESIFEKFVQLVLDKTDPLSPAVLTYVTTAFRNTKTLVSHNDLAFHAGQSLFQRITERFADDVPAQISAIDSALSAVGSQNPKIAGVYVQLCESLRKKDVPALIQSLENIEAGNLAMEIGSLWHLCHSGVSLLETIYDVSSATAVRARLLERSLQAGLMGESRINQPSGLGYPDNDISKFAMLMQKDILPALDVFPVNTARLLIAHSFSTGGLENLRALLTGPSEGWLEKIISGNIPGQKKLEWIAALLEPFDSDIVKANILDAAAKNAADKKTAEILSSLEKNLTGKNIRLTEDKILCNLQNIANIWYHEGNKMLKYTVQGQSYILLDNLSPQSAGEILSLIHRRGSFIQEHNGLFNPENIDAIHHRGDKTSISWYRVDTSLNTDATTASALKKRTDFIHVTDPATGDVSSYNLSSICLLQKLEDGSSLMIDKYGKKEILTGKIAIPQNTRLLDISSNAKFNPENAGVIKLAPENSTLEFRIESADFDTLLNPRTGQFFYQVEVKDASTLSSLKTQLGKLPGMHAPNKTDLADLYFNMAALGYLALNEKSTGLYCKRHSRIHKPGLIQVSAEMAEEILSGIGNKPGIIRIGDLLMHEDSIDDAYYDVKKRKLQFVIGQEVQEVAVSADDGFNTLLRLAKNGNFMTVSSMPRPSYPGMAPTDAVHINRVTFASYEPEKKNTYMTTENMTFPVGLNSAEAGALFSSIEERGLKSTHQATQSNLWTMDLGAALAKLQMLNVRVAPFISIKTPQVLLQQLLGLKRDEPAGAKKLQDEFATVAKLPAANERFHYPERKKPAQKRTGSTPGRKTHVF